MPHESTVGHENKVSSDRTDPHAFDRQRSKDICKEPKTGSLPNPVIQRLQSVPHLRAETPTKVTHSHDFDYDIDDTSSTGSDKST